MSPFRLHTLLRLRIAERDERRGELAKALRAEAVLQAEHVRLAAEQADQAQRQRSLKSPGEADIDALVIAHRYEIVLAAQARQLAAQQAQVAAEIERRRQVLVEADRQVRVLEKLRERKAATARIENERREAKRYDEAATIGHLRKEAAP